MTGDPSIASKGYEIGTNGIPHVKKMLSTTYTIIMNDFRHIIYDV